jgi:hypothetical protein
VKASRNPARIPPMKSSVLGNFMMSLVRAVDEMSYIIGLFFKKSNVIIDIKERVTAAREKILEYIFFKTWYFFFEIQGTSNPIVEDSGHC